MPAKSRPRAAARKLVGRLALETEQGSFLGDTRIRLLEGIGRLGSITQAAKAIPLSYKAAWDAVNDMNNLADRPLVERAVGGRHGGGTRLTDYGRRMIAFYRALEEDTQGVLDRVAARLREAGEGDADQYRELIGRMSVISSARNQFVGRVCALREGAVNFEVVLRLDAHTEIAATITRESARRMGLAIGKPAQALVKASSVILMTDPQLRLSARNRLWGEVSAVHPGAVNDEVALSLPGARTVVAVVTRESVRRLGLAEGVRACAVFDAASVILAVHAS